MSKNFDPAIGLNTQFKKGQLSRNPGGRPKKAALTDALIAVLGERVPEDKKRRTFAEAIARRLAIDAANGNLRAAVEIFDRTEGKSRQCVEIQQCSQDQNGSAKYEYLESLSGEELVHQLASARVELDRDLDRCGTLSRVQAAEAEIRKSPGP